MGDIRGVGSLMIRYRSLIRSGIFAMAALMSLSFLYRDFLLSRSVYLMTAVLACGFMALMRYLFRFFDRFLAAQGLAAWRVVLVGTDGSIQEIADRIRIHGATVKVIGIIRWEENAKTTSRRPAEHSVLGSFNHLEEIFRQTPYEVIIICSPEGAREKGLLNNTALLRLINFCEKNDISTFFSPSSFDVAVTQQEVGSLSGVPLIRIQDASLHPMHAIVKRFFDFIVAIFLITLTFPLWILIALLIKATDRGSVFYRQKRAGLHGRPFQMYKFRTMVPDAEQKLLELVDINALPEPVFKLQNDPRITRIGQFLRRYGLDELPQLMNVIKGEMSLVGPRPEEMQIVERYDPLQRRRLKAMPGITGYQQIMNRGEPKLDERIKYDLIYLKHQGFLFDLYIFIRTIDVVLRGRGITG